ncbi:MAG: nucleotide exchange factor GrpE [Salinispira sp.]
MAEDNQSMNAETEKNEENAEHGDAASPDDMRAEQQETIEELRRQIEELNDQYIRKQADLDNYRKRIFREKDEAVRYANKQILLDIITVIDDFERAIQSSESSKDFDSLHDGIILIEKQFTDMLERKWGLSRFEADGVDFDPEKHEAIMVEDRPDTDRQIVLQIFQQGYMLRDNVLRTAKVKVSQPVSLQENTNR